MKLSLGERSTMGRAHQVILRKMKLSISAKDDTSSIVGFGARFIRISLGSSSTSVNQEETSSCSGANSVTTSGPDFSTSDYGSESSTITVLTMAGGSGSTPFVAMFSKILPTLARSSLHSATSSLRCGLSSLGSCSILGSS